MPHSAVSRRQLDRAKSLRRQMMRAEVLLWRYLKAGHLDQLSFRRQTPIGSYIVDFVCHAARLVVEIDGDTHDFEERQCADGIRDAWLGERGYAVLRFTNADVLSSLEGVLLTIRDTARARLRESAVQGTPLPVPPPQGGRELSNHHHASPQAGTIPSTVRPAAPKKSRGKLP